MKTGDRVEIVSEDTYAGKDVFAGKRATIVTGGPMFTLLVDGISGLYLRPRGGLKLTTKGAA